MKSHLIFLSLTISLLISGCGNKSDNIKNKPAFGELENYFISETETLQKSHRSLRKVIYNNNKTEHVIVEVPDWQKELKIFTSCIANKKNLENSFIIDSVNVNNQRILKYSARDESVDIKSLSVFRTKNHIDSIIIMTSVINMYYSATDTLIYFGSGNYRINAQNEPAIGKKISFVLIGNIQ